METLIAALCFFVRREVALAAFVFVCVPSLTRAVDRQHPPTNEYGAAVLDANGQHINYDRQTLETMARTAALKKLGEQAESAARTIGRSEFVPAAPTDQRPFWQYAIFGSGIGASNIVIGPPPVGGGVPEILIGGNAANKFGGFGPDDFWQSIRWNPTTSTYDQVFVSQVYTYGGSSAAINRIAMANVVGDSSPEIVVMLDDGRIYLYDFATKAELGYLNTGISGLKALCLTDLDGDGHAELIVTTASDLYVFNGAGVLLWQVAGAGGTDVVAGQMDNDPAIEIATTSGKVVDATTHTVQWTRAGGFGNHLALAPLQGAAYMQLIEAEAWQHVFSYDIALQIPLWSIDTPQDIDAILVADVDNDGIPELIIGDGQFGTVHVHDLITQAQKWAANNPESGVTNIAVGDVDGDGIVDLLWGAGWTSTGSDYFYVASTTGSHAIKWQSVDLQGPFLGPIIGDLDGDGHPELVLCSVYSEATYDSGRILVFDLATLTLRGISAPVVNNNAWSGVRDLKLRDVDGDGRMEIVIAAANLSDAVIEIYKFDSNNTFTLTWTNASRPPNSTFDFVEVADIDNNGTRKIIGGNDSAVYAYDYPSGINSWQSVNLGNTVTGLIVQDLDGDGNKEIAALVASNNGDLYTWDGPSRQLRNLRQSTGLTMLGNQLSPARLIGGDSVGVGHFLEYGRNRYTEPLTRQLGNGSLNGVNPGAGGALWTGSGNVLTLRLAPSFNDVVWQSPAFGGNFGRFVATDFRNGQNRVFSSAQQATVGFTYTVPAPTVVSAVSRKNHGAAGLFDVLLPLSGTPGIECRTGGPTNDYQVVVTFANPVAVNGTPQAQVTSGIATIGSGGVSDAGLVTTSGNSVTVPLTNVANAQTIQITLFGVSDGLGSGNVVVSMSTLIGDTNGNGTVNSADVAQTKARFGQALDTNNFRSDANASGGINSTDVAIIKSNTGQGQF
jgi:hypothetical protein